MRGIWLITLFFVYGLPLFSQPAFFDNLVGYWTFDKDTDSIVKDYSGLNNYGTSYDISYDLLPEGKAAVFNSPTSQINIPGKGMTPPVSISSLSSGSISVWFKYENIADGQIMPILYFGEEDIGTPHNSLIIEIGHSHLLANRKLYFTIVNQRFCFDSKDNLEENRWYHFVAVVDESGNRGYLDGNLMTNRNYNLGSDSTYTNFFSSVDSAEVLSIGYGRYGIEDPFFHYKGNIDEVSIFAYSVNSAEVKELYLYGRQKIFGLNTKLPCFSFDSNDISGHFLIHQMEYIQLSQMIWLKEFPFLI